MSIAYVKRVPEEYKESPLSTMGLDEYWAEAICIEDNGVCGANLSDEYRTMHDDWWGAWNSMDDVLNVPEDAMYRSVRAVIEDYFPHSCTRGDYTQEEIEEWKDLLNFMHDCDVVDEPEGIAHGISLMTGHEWAITGLHGCCQGDYIEIMYDKTKLTHSDLMRFEYEFFNTGTEWLAYDGEVGEHEPNPDDDGFWCSYYTDYDDTDALKEMLGVDELVVFEPKRIMTTVYEREVY